jgi:hypothetical protein
VPTVFTLEGGANWISYAQSQNALVEDKGTAVSNRHLLGIEASPPSRLQEAMKKWKDNQNRMKQISCRMSKISFGGLA